MSSPPRSPRPAAPARLRRFLVGVAALFGFLGAGLAMAPVAGAHHANLSVTAKCTEPAAPNTYKVSYQASSWTSGAGGANSDVRVEYQINGGAWQTGASFSFPNSPTTPSKSGSFEISADTEITSLKVRIKAFANWASGNTDKGPWATQTVTLPPTDCVPPPPPPVECADDESGVDENGNGIVDGCEPNPVECADDEVAVDSDGNGIVDGCEPNPVECADDELAVDTDGNGIVDACEPDDVEPREEEPEPTEVLPRTQTRVLGQQVGQSADQVPTLPRTGGDLADLSLLAMGLVLIGAGLARSSTRTR